MQFFAYTFQSKHILYTGCPTKRSPLLSILIAYRKTRKQNERVIVKISVEKPVTSNILWKRRNWIKIVVIRVEVVTMKSFLPLNLTWGTQSGETCTQTCVKSWGTSRWSISERTRGHLLAHVNSTYPLQTPQTLRDSTSFIFRCGLGVFSV